MLNETSKIVGENIFMDFNLWPYIPPVPTRSPSSSSSSSSSGSRNPTNTLPPSLPPVRHQLHSPPSSQNPANPSFGGSNGLSYRSLSAASAASPPSSPGSSSSSSQQPHVSPRSATPSALSSTMNPRHSNSLGSSRRSHSVDLLASQGSSQTSVPALSLTNLASSLPLSVCSSSSSSSSSQSSNFLPNASFSNRNDFSQRFHHNLSIVTKAVGAFIKVYYGIENLYRPKPEASMSFLDYACSYVPNYDNTVVSPSPKYKKAFDNSLAIKTQIDLERIPENSRSALNVRFTTDSKDVLSPSKKKMFSDSSRATFRKFDKTQMLFADLAEEPIGDFELIKIINANNLDLLKPDCKNHRDALEGYMEEVFKQIPEIIAGSNPPLNDLEKLALYLLNVSESIAKFSLLVFKDALDALITIVYFAAKNFKANNYTEIASDIAGKLETELKCYIRRNDWSLIDCQCQIKKASNSDVDECQAKISIVFSNLSSFDMLLNRLLDQLRPLMGGDKHRYKQPVQVARLKDLKAIIKKLNETLLTNRYVSQIFYNDQGTSALQQMLAIAEGRQPIVP